MGAKYPRYKAESAYNAVVTPLLLWPTLIWLVGVWFIGSWSLSDRMGAFALTILIWPLVASLLIGPIGPFLTYANAFDKHRREHPGASVEECDAAGLRAARRRCNCPNFVTNLGLPHVSDCPRFGEPRGR